MLHNIHEIKNGENCTAVMLNVLDQKRSQNPAISVYCPFYKKKILVFFFFWGGGGGRVGKKAISL